MIDWEAVLFGQRYLPWSRRGRLKRKIERLDYVDTRMPGDFTSHNLQRMESFKATIAYGVEATRAAAYINAGVAVGVFGLFQKLDATNIERGLIGPSYIILMLGAGVILSGFSSGLSYISQGRFTEEMRLMGYDYMSGSMKTTEKSVEARYIGEIWRRGAMYAFFLSYALLVISLFSVAMLL